MQATLARPKRGLVDVDMTSLPSLWDARHSASQQRLHAYEVPVKSYVEVKIGGHPLDHKHAAPYRPALVVSAPMKMVPRGVSLNQSPAFGVHYKEKMQYVEVKIGGHRYDHKRCVSLEASLVGFNDQLATIERGALGCALCQSFTDDPLVQLYCRHAVCAPCFETMAINDHATRVMCGVCFQKVPFLRPAHQAAATTTHKSVKRSLSLETVTLAAASATLGHYGPKAVRRISHALRSISIGTRLTSPPETKHEVDDVQELVNTIVDMDGATRWANRVASLLEPSKLLRYEYVRTLGSGNFSEVMLMKRRSSQKLCVLKESDKLQEAMNEVNLLSKLKSPHIVRLDGYFIEQIGHLHYVYLELEYCNNGTLHDYIAKLVRRLVVSS
ncbi:NEK protein kinase, variant [Saprolegnia diclina VS20]|uniref:non-specific serine/threonine protein kinase n=1 Tax=Saprolegnia diclina (strain VS20) TaxID=1156394 RepID=T0RWA4_SAPDV|nr:NEK protein kinase, variant [Saprolegnia diclina VS20]EQC34612.1 NEK protein kinase, variant [Saprolegnia diclina VS20]|eukprot:XP_008612018.1 NEK protein kinase, variant [Saprolegnia diclina VS20]